MAPKAQQVEFLLSQVRNSTGSLASGTVTFYAAGTTTLKTIWTDRDEATPAANPYTLDANGTAQIYASGLYKVLIKNAAGTTIYTRDNLYFEFSPSDDIDALQYSPYTFTQATIQAALTAIGTTNKATLLLRPGNWVILTALAFPANVEVHIPNGTYFSGAGADEITFAGDRDINPRWWYDGGGDWTVALNIALSYSNSRIVIHNATYDVSSIVTSSAANSEIFNYGVIKAKTGSNFGSNPILLITGDKTIYHNLVTDGNRGNVTDNGLAGNQPNILLYSGLSNVTFLGGEIKNSVYSGVVFNGSSKHIVFDNVYLNNIGEHGFYVSGGTNIQTRFQNIRVNNIGQNSVMAASHNTAVIRARFTTGTDNNDMVVENMSASCPTAPTSTVITVFGLNGVNGMTVRNLRVTSAFSGVAIFSVSTAYNRNIVFDNINAPVGFVYSVTDTPHIENVILQNSTFTGGVFGYANIFAKISNCVFENLTSFGTDLVVWTPPAGHSTVVENSKFTGTYTSSSPFKISDMTYDLTFRDCKFAINVNTKAFILKITGDGGTPGVTGRLRFFNSDFSGCTNVARLFWIYVSIAEISFIDCNIQSAMRTDGATDVLVIKNTITDAATAITGTFAAYYFQGLRGTKKSENSGTATITAAATTVNVDTGTLIDPALTEITIHPVKTLAAAAFWWITTRVGGFTINLNAAPGGAATVDFAWKARIKQ